MSTEPQLPFDASVTRSPSPPSLPFKEHGDAPIVIADRTIQELHFNVMSERPVSETLRPNEYFPLNVPLKSEAVRDELGASQDCRWKLRKQLETYHEEF